MTSPWPTRPLGELCTLINGRAFKPGDWGTEGLPIVRIQNLNDANKPFNHYSGPYQERNLIDSQAILLSWSGTPGTSFGCFRWGRGPGILNQHIFKVLVNTERIDGDFFIHAVNSRLDEMIGQAHGGVGLRHITKGKLEAIHLPLPALEEQRRIVARINECMERVEEIEALRAEARQEALHLEASLYSAIEATEDAPLVCVGEVIVAAKNGRSIVQAANGANGYVLSLAAVRKVMLDLTAKKPIVLPESVAQTYRINPGDVFVSRSNTRDLVGLSAFAESASDERLIYPDLLIRLQPDQALIRPRYLAFALRTAESRQQIKDRAVGTSQSMVKISGERLKEVRIRLPSLDSQCQLEEKLDESRAAVDCLIAEQNGTDTAMLRDAILRKAFAGGF